MRLHLSGIYKQSTYAVLVLWLIFMVLPGTAVAANVLTDPSCAPIPFPSTPSGPTWTLTPTDVAISGARRLTFWRLPCDASNSNILVRFEPLTNSGAIPDTNGVMVIIQNGVQYYGSLYSQNFNPDGTVAHPTNAFNDCAKTRYLPITCRLGGILGQGGWDDDQAFTVFELSSPGLRLNIPAYNGSTVDSDNDGIPDISDNCPNVSNAVQVDTDGDGIGDACDPLTDSDGDGIANNVDTDDDNDGMPDAYELAKNFNPLDASDANADADGDGYSNWQEYQAGTDPLNKASYPSGQNLMQNPLRVSTSSVGVEGNDSSSYLYRDSRPFMSANGRYVVFESIATNLVPGDTNQEADIFIKDTQTGITTRVSTDSAGVEGDKRSVFASISEDGRYVVFQSLADNLVPGDPYLQWDIFLKDTQTDVTTLVDTNSAGVAANTAYSTTSPSISADGRYVAFESIATNLVPGDTNNQSDILDTDIFVKDTRTGVTTRVSTDSAGVEGNDFSVFPTISADGRYVVFLSAADNLVPGDTNLAMDIFLKDTQTGMTTRVSTSSAGVEANYGAFNTPSISANGRYVAFESISFNLVPGDTNSSQDIFVKDTRTGVTTRVSTDIAGVEKFGKSQQPSISADGRYVAFLSAADNLVPGDTNQVEDIFIKDTLTGAIARVNTDNAGAEGNGSSSHPFMSADGRYVVFVSIASNLVPGDTNLKADVFRASNPLNSRSKPRNRAMPWLSLLLTQIGFDYPVGRPNGSGYYVAQDFGEFNTTFNKYHLGEDWNGVVGANQDCNVDEGDPVYAISNGKVAYAGFYSQSWGNIITIHHTLSTGEYGRVVESMYAHLETVLVSNGGTVKRGEKIGTIGKTGTSAGNCAHLHFEIRSDETIGADQGYSLTPKPAGWLDPSDFIDSHR